PLSATAALRALLGGFLRTRLLPHPGVAGCPQCRRTDGRATRRQPVDGNRAGAGLAGGGDARVQRRGTLANGRLSTDRIVPRRGVYLAGRLLERAVFQLCRERIALTAGCAPSGPKERAAVSRFSGSGAAAPGRVLRLHRQTGRQLGLERRWWARFFSGL